MEFDVVDTATLLGVTTVVHRHTEALELLLTASNTAEHRSGVHV